MVNKTSSLKTTLTDVAKVSRVNRNTLF